MTERERLIKLLQDHDLDEEPSLDGLYEWADDIADYLLANGVIVPPVNIGDTVYTIGFDKEDGHYIADLEVIFVGNELFVADECCSYSEYSYSDIGESVFLTYEEAEKALLKESE